MLWAVAEVFCVVFSHCCAVSRVFWVITYWLESKVSIIFCSLNIAYAHLSLRDFLSILNRPPYVWLLIALITHLSTTSHMIWGITHIRHHILADFVNGYRKTLASYTKWLRTTHYITRPSSVMFSRIRYKYQTFDFFQLDRIINWSYTKFKDTLRGNFQQLESTPLDGKSREKIRGKKCVVVYSSL